MANRFVAVISRNDLFSLSFIILVAASPSAFTPSQKPNPALPAISVPGRGSFDLSSYASLHRRDVGLVNFRECYRVTDLSDAGVNDLSMLPLFQSNYFLPFLTPSLITLLTVTPLAVSIPESIRGLAGRGARSAGGPAQVQ